MDVFDAASKYKEANEQLVIVAGKDYGSGSSRDWAAKGPWLLVSWGAVGGEISSTPRYGFMEIYFICQLIAITRSAQRYHFLLQIKVEPFVIVTGS